MAPLACPNPLLCRSLSPLQAHANLANALQQLGAVDLALMYYSSALRLKPAFTDALNNMATAHLQKGAVAQVRAWAARGGAAAHPSQRPAARPSRRRLPASRDAVAVPLQTRQAAPAWRCLGTCAAHPCPAAPAWPALQAMEAYQAALAISPGLPDVRTNLGDLWRAQVRRRRRGPALRRGQGGTVGCLRIRNRRSKPGVGWCRGRRRRIPSSAQCTASRPPSHTVHDPAR